MSLPESLGSIYESIARVWRARFIAASRRPPTEKHVLCGYVSTVDRCIQVTEALVQALITESGVSPAEIKTARAAASQPVSKAQTRADLAMALLWCLEHRGGRISIDQACILNWLNDLFRRFGHGQERLGGAPGSMIDTLTRLCHEPNAAIFTVFHSERQASVYGSDGRFLTADAPCALGTVEAHRYHQVRSDHLDDPEVRNYALEYQPGERLSWGPNPADCVAATQGPDRLICTAPFLHFDADDHVREGDSPAAIERIFQYPGLTDEQRDSCVAASAATYLHMAFTGLQGAGERHRPAIERDLALLCDRVTLHVELSAARNLAWLQTVIPRYVSSVGINDDELPGVCEMLTGETKAVAGKYDSIWAFYQDARTLAVALDLPRLYVHTHLADLVLRRAPVEDKLLAEEILADLYAKWVVARFLGSSPPSGHTPGIGIKREGLEALTTFMSQVAGLSGKTLLEWLADTSVLALRGHCSVVADYAVAVVPVAWFLGSLAQAIITTGAGDRSSVISFVQSDFTFPRPSSPA